MRALFRTLIALIYLASATLAQAGFVINSFQFGAPPVCSFVTAVTDATGLTTYSFASASIGTAAADRFVIVGPMGRGAGGAARTISSATIGGNAATLISNNSNANFSGFIGLTVPTGTTATIDVTMSAGMNQMTIVIFTCTGLASTTPEDLDFNSAADPTFQLNVSAASWTIACAMQDSGTATTTWTGPTEVYDAINESSMTAAIIQQATANAAYTVTATFSAGTSGSMTGLSMK